jgi:hypothetical protein
MYLAHRFLSPWWWRHYVPPKRRFTQEPHDVTSQKMTFLFFVSHVHKDLACLIRYYSFLGFITVKVRKHFNEQKTKNLYDQCYIAEDWLYTYIQHDKGFPVMFSVSCRPMKITHLSITALTISHVVLLCRRVYKMYGIVAKAYYTCKLK